MTSDDEMPSGGAKPSAEERVKQLSRVVCICKGISLGKILEVIDGCETVADVNRRAGTGSGGCQGERCGPRIKILLRKMRERKGG